MRKIVARAAIAAAVMAGGLAGAPSANAVYLGGVDFGGWCRSAPPVGLAGAGAEPRDRNNAWSWRCTYLGIMTTFPVDYNKACRYQYGDQTAWGKPLDGRNPWSWRCYN